MFDNDDNSTGRVKGAIKDRIISFLYRKRFKIKLLRNKLIKKETKVKFIFKKKTEVKTYRDLKKLGDKVIEVDVKNEKFDFDKYDYYIVEPIKKKGIDTGELKNVAVTKSVINTSKSIINNVSKDIKKIDINMKYPKEHKEDLSISIDAINNNVNKLKKELNKIDNVDTTKLDNFKVPSNEEELKNSYEIIKYYQDIIDSKENDIKVIETISKTQFSKNVGINVNNTDIKKETKKKDAKNNYKKSIKNIKVYKTSIKDIEKRTNLRRL